MASEHETREDYDRILSEASVLEHLRKVVVDQLGVDAGAVTREARFDDDLGCDSLDVIELVMACEEAFKLEIPDADVDFASVGDVVAYLVERLGERRHVHAEG